jgi:hypothetical protein
LQAQAQQASAVFPPAATPEPAIDDAAHRGGSNGI